MSFVRPWEGSTCNHCCIDAWPFAFRSRWRLATSRSAMRSSKSRGLGQFAGAAPISIASSSILLLGCLLLASSGWGWALFGAAFRAACYGSGKRGGALPGRCRARCGRGDFCSCFSSVLRAASDAPADESATRGVSPPGAPPTSPSTVTSTTDWSRGSRGARRRVQRNNLEIRIGTTNISTPP